MTVEKIYQAYISGEKPLQDQDLETTMAQVLEGLRKDGVDTMKVEEQINNLLDRQEAIAFRAGFCEAAELFFSIMKKP